MASAVAELHEPSRPLPPARLVRLVARIDGNLGVLEKRVG
jgi:hypothetical protein